jgi:exonuclease SbcD
MAFRILHTSDWHLGQHFYGKSRAYEHQQFLTWLIAQVKQQEIDVVIVAGDIFDTGTPPSYAREMYFDFIVQMKACHCQLIILAGNHDSVAVLAEAKHLLAQLSCTVVPIASSIDCQQVFTLQNRQGQDSAVLCAIPYIRPRDVSTSVAGQTAEDKQHALQENITEHYNQLYLQAEQLAKQTDKPLPIIATGHLTTVGASVTESVRDIYIGTLEAFPANAFPPADYIALGHIHRCQKVAKSEHIRYCGSPIPLSFDEAKQDKKVLVAEFSSTKLTQVSELLVPCFQPMAMVKTQLQQVEKDIKAAIDAKPAVHNGQKLWLDIEVNSSDYLHDITPRIMSMTENLPVEILLVRRSKQFRASMPNTEANVTLNELSLQDVFNSRLAQEQWQTDEELLTKQRLSNLFAQALEQVQSDTNSDETNSKSDDTRSNESKSDDANFNSDETNSADTQSTAPSKLDTNMPLSELPVNNLTDKLGKQP